MLRWDWVGAEVARWLRVGESLTTHHGAELMLKLLQNGTEPSADDPHTDAFPTSQLPLTQPINNTPLEEPLCIRPQTCDQMLQMVMKFGVVILWGWRCREQIQQG